MVFTYIKLLIKSLLFNRFKSIGAAFGGAPKGAPPPWGMLLNLLNNCDFINNVILVKTRVKT